VLKFLWLEKSIGVTLDKRVGDNIMLLTEYFSIIKICLGRSEVISRIKWLDFTNRAYFLLQMVQ
jgi:hypothetical protein